MFSQSLFTPLQRREQPDKDTLTHDRHKDRPNATDVTENLNGNVFIVDWDGPGDPYNPKT